MTDIVERLRAEGAMAGYYDAPAIQREAADEIERLRAECVMWRDENVKKQTACEQMGARIVALEAERDNAVEQSNDWHDLTQKARKEVAGAMILVDMLRDAALGHQERAERLRAALRRISLASQNSGTTKEFLGREARAALAKEFDNEADQ